MTRSWQLAGIVPLGSLDHLALLGSKSVGVLLGRTAESTTEAVELLPLQVPGDPR